jgi:tRNA(fMet)-specific endonuclease VapC
MFLFDTDHIGILQRQSEPEFSRLSPRVAKLSPGEFFVPIISFHEQVLGWNTYISRAKRPDGVVRGYRQFEKILRDFAAAQIASFDDAAAGLFEQFRQKRIRIGTMDLRIAAIAQARGLTLLTRNTVDFAHVPGLQIEDWTG